MSNAAGRTVKALAQPKRTATSMFWTAPRCKYLHGTQYVDKLNWSKGLDEAGRPIVDPQFVPTAEGKELSVPVFSLWKKKRLVHRGL